MNIIISGAMGAMGRVVAENAAALGIAVAAGVDREDSDALAFPVYSDFQRCPTADAIIDFSHPSALPALLTFAAERRLPAVIATTGVGDGELSAIRTAAVQTPIFFTFNMSLGVNLLVSLAKKAAAVLGDGFDIEIVEKHHNQKLDAPSGTAVMLANSVAEAVPYAPEFVYSRQPVRQKRARSEIGIHSVRGGNIVGEHEVIFAGTDEIVTLSHSARSKKIFAAGALKAAGFLQGRAPGLYDMDDLLNAAGEEE